MQLFDGVTDLGLVKDGGAQPPNIEAGQRGDGQILSRVRLSGRTYITALPLSLTRDVGSQEHAVGLRGISRRS